MGSKGISYQSQSRRSIGGKIKIEISSDGRSKITFNLAGNLFKDKGIWINYCPPLDISTCGKTKKEAIDNMKEAVKIFFAFCLQKGTLDKALRELNWKPGEINFDTLAGSRDRCHTPRLPPAFILAQTKNNGWKGRLELTS